VGSSVNLGQTFVSANPNKPVSKAILALAEMMSPSATIIDKKRSGRWFSFMQ
jgi:hypothetical protein